MSDSFVSPTTKRKMRAHESATQIPSSKKHQAPQLPVVMETTFFLPGVDVKVGSKINHNFFFHMEHITKQPA